MPGQKAFAIVGTAQTWKETPWHDPAYTIGSLNDAYMLGFPRAGIWFELHPLDHFIFRKRTPGHDVPAVIPAGYYLRPEGHVEWLRAKSHKMPIALQAQPPDGWGANAFRYPVESITATYREVLNVDPTWTKPYVSSGPSWMLLWAMDQGFDHFGIYGIHLSTAREYLEQRPNFEALVLWAIGKGCTVTVPKSCPLFKAEHVYCYEPRPSQVQDPLRHQLAQLDGQRQPLVREVFTRPWWRPTGSLLRQIAEIDARKIDIKQQLTRIAAQQAFASPEWRI